MAAARSIDCGTGILAALNRTKIREI